jgi:murein L,D-transpeptidase YcbB/YkuD
MNFDLIASTLRRAPAVRAKLESRASRSDNSNWRLRLPKIAAFAAAALTPPPAGAETLSAWTTPAHSPAPAILQICKAAVRPSVLAYRERADSWTGTADAFLAQNIDVSRALALALEDWVKAPLNRPRASEQRKRRLAIAEFYAAQGHEPLWRDGANFSTAAVSILRVLREADRDALDLRSMRPPTADAGWSSVQIELDLSEAVLEYAAQAAGERVDPRKISRLIGMRPALPDAAQVLASVSAAGSAAGEMLQNFNPPHEGYRALKEKLAELRATRSAGAHAFETRVADAGTSATDMIMRRDVAGLSARDPRAAEAEIIANMERWRWLPRDLGDDRVEVNIPDFELALKHRGAVTHRTRVIVGKTTTPTPIFSDRMRFVVINPSWSVPPSIIQKEMAGPHSGDLSYLSQRGFQVSYRNGRASVRQPPGERNALGRVKFVFPNDYSVYMHDTPSRGLFGLSRRAFSHGCVRVDQPFKLAEVVLASTAEWSEKRLRQLIGNSERRIDLAEPLPVHIEYFTAFVDERGELQLRDDIYGYSAKVRAALKLDGV